jgi:hypothetical protein
VTNSNIRIQNKKYIKELLSSLNKYPDCDDKQDIIDLIKLVGVFSTYISKTTTYKNGIIENGNTRLVLNLKNFYDQAIKNINKPDFQIKYNCIIRQIEHIYTKAEIREFKLKLLIKN